MAKAIIEYASHFHFFDEYAVTGDTQEQTKRVLSPKWLIDATDFSAVPGKGIQCCIDGKLILVRWC